MRNLLFLVLVLMLAACTEKSMQFDASITPYRDGKQCAISFTYDDGMLCHYTDIAPELEKRGFRGTFWIIGNNMDKVDPGYPWMTWEQVADLANRGHEMSNHTWNHPSLPGLTPDLVAEELKLCDDKLESVTGCRPITMAYPYNAMSPEVVALCEKNRVATRTFQTGHGQHNSYTTPDSMRVWLQGLLERGEWGVTMTHGTTYGWDLWDRPEELYHFYDVVKELDDSVWVGTFAQVAAYRAEQAVASVMVQGTAHSVTLTVTHHLDPSLFTEPLTIRIRGGNWNKVQPTATQAGLPVSVINCGDELLISVLPGDVPAQIVW